MVGGVGSQEYLWEDVELRLVTEAYSKDNIVAAICISPVVCKGGCFRG
ncbi:MAG: hypothetical protein QMD22_03815 [archaeon]|nr:hypothetical protein [archaeon]